MNLNLFDPPYQAHSATSIEAAERIRPSSESLREQVYRWLCEHGPATDEEMQIALEMNPSTQRPRRIELIGAGRVVAMGEGRTRSGRRATKWAAVLRWESESA